jgi:hypothetical protein
MSEEKGFGKHKNPLPAVDFIISKEDKSKILLLVRRKNDPFKGMLSIPGGFYKGRRNSRRRYDAGGQRRDFPSCRTNCNIRCIF